jgi:hypothetical protein
MRSGALSAAIERKRSGSPIGVRYLSKSCRRRASCSAAEIDPERKPIVHRSIQNTMRRQTQAFPLLRMDRGTLHTADRRLLEHGVECNLKASVHHADRPASTTTRESARPPCWDRQFVETMLNWR